MRQRQTRKEARSFRIGAGYCQLFPMPPFLVVSLLFSASVHGCPINSSEEFQQERNGLYKALFDDYNQRLPPFATFGSANRTRLSQLAIQPFMVVLDMHSLKLIRVVEAERKVDFLFNYEMLWVDERLKWSPEEYCGIDRLYVERETVWVPEISVMDAHSSEDYREEYKKYVWLESSGSASFFIPTRTSTVCNIKVEDFPFDKQKCSINMAQMFPVREYVVNVRISKGVLANTTEGDGEWQTKNITVESNLTDGGDDVYQISSFVVTMKRNPSFYIVVVILPSFLINLLSILGVFLNPDEHVGNLGITLTNIMSLTFVLGILATDLPKTRVLPRIAIYVLTNLGIMIAALIVVLTLPFIRRKFIVPSVRDDNEKGEPRNDEKAAIVYSALRYGMFLLFELANLANFVVLLCP
ncbi:hypothetical protein Q1695_005044 [Nippostrongylus brasiliensis]|nr:hypothetical protein Q1695_005044 [Nippostrongylus brasiliensis]